jgi:hypothetical protein
VAISNNRLLDSSGGHVRFTYKDYRADPRHAAKTMTLAASEFIRRFLLHVLPRGFHRIRYYGFLGARHRRTKLARCQELLASSAPITTPPAAPPATADYRDRMEALTGVSLRTCPACHRGQMIVIERRGPVAALTPDTS